MTSCRLFVSLALMLAATLPLGLLASCTGDIGEPGASGDSPRVEGETGPGPGPGEPDDPTRPATASCDAFEPTAPHAYGAKVKSLLIGLPLTAEELSALQGDADALTGLIDEWLSRPEADTKLLSFFATAFQQEGFEEGGLTEQWSEPDIRTGFLADENTNGDIPFRENFETSFARTALDIVRSGRPFNEVVTTRQFMLTTAMMTAMAFQDDRHKNDAGNAYYQTTTGVIRQVHYQNRTQHPGSQVTDPASPNFMQFYAASDRIVPACAGGILTSEAPNAPLYAFRSIFGYFARFRSSGCAGEPNFPAPGLLSRADYEDWRLVTIRRPNAGEQTTSFYDLDHLRTTTEFVAHTPRVGFFTTPAFFAVWQTNEDNQSRVTANQTLITAFNQSIDDSSIIFPTRDDAIDGSHADPTTDCWGCHKTLDPMRQIFRQEYTYFSSEQRDEEVRAVPAAFAWDGVSEEPGTIFEFADIIAEHPQFARGWVRKMCFYANSAACPEGPEFDAVVSAFVESDYDFAVMLRELFSSPLVTSDSCVEDGSGDNAGISRTRHFCAALSNRLDIEDACGARMFFQDQQIPIREQNSILISTIPNDTFSRGDQDPLVVSDVNLFIRGTYERICSNTARILIGEEGRFAPSAAAAAIGFFTEELMGFPVGDPRRDGAEAILQEHFERAQAEEGGRAAVDSVSALQSTFVVACLSPTLIGMGL